MKAGLYIHIPFCKTRCNYCHFVTRRWDAPLADRYCRAVLREIDAFREGRPDPLEVDSIYFGGGTPSMVPAEHITRLLAACREMSAVTTGNCEISIEANPGTLSAEKVMGYAAAGVNRVSLGAQTLNEAELLSISRSHTARQIEDSVRVLRDCSIQNINLDLMLGLPGQTQNTWNENLRAIIGLNPAHLSIYMLDLDLDSPLKRTVAEGIFSIPEDDLLADWYTEAIDFLKQAGYVQYEISNFSKPGYECRHNLKYWLRGTVIGFGVGSHSFDGRRRYANTPKLDAYLSRTEEGKPAIEWSEEVEQAREIEEALFLGLRLSRGVNLSELRCRFGRELLSPYERTLKEMSTSGFIEWNDSTIRLTTQGILVSNEIFQQILN